jgi:hypothetical protein
MLKKKEGATDSFFPTRTTSTGHFGLVHLPSG